MKATGERCDRCLWQEKGAERVAAVDKIEEKRKPGDFIGHRNRNCPSGGGMRYNRANRLKPA